MIHLFFILGLLIRLIFPDLVPPGMSHDELEYLLNGYSIYQTGRDLYSNLLPITIGSVGYVSLPAYIYSLSFTFLPLGPLAARLIPALLGSLEIYFLYGICQKLFQRRQLSLFAGAILALSPWGIMISRMAFDPPLSLFFYLLGIYLCLRSSTPRKFLFSLLVFTLGLFSYYGSIFIYPFVVLLFTWYKRRLLHKKHIIFAISFIGISLSLLYLSFQNADQSQSLKRASELIISDLRPISDQVIFERFHTNGPAIFSQLFVNKFTQFLDVFFTNYLGAFTPAMLFVSGDPQRIYGLWTHGGLNLMDLPLILLGIYFLIRKFPRPLTFVFLLLLIAPLTSGLTGPVYATRSFLLWPALIIIAAAGAYFLFSRSRLIFFLLLPLYLFFSAQGIHQYFFRYSVYANEIWFGSEKQLSNYLIDNQDTSYIIKAPESRQMFMQYLFYSGFDPQDVQKVLDKNNVLADIHYQNLTFINGCPTPNQPSKRDLITHHTCFPDKQFYSPLITAQDRSDRIIWYISNSED